jgi:hypothetical protein
MIKIAKTQGSGWYEYVEQNPHLQRNQAKVSYIQGADDFYIVYGVYNSGFGHKGPNPSYGEVSLPKYPSAQDSH